MDAAGVNTVCYCCVWKEGQVVYSYSSGNHEIDDLAPLCLEMIPPYHRFYFETIAPYTFAFFVDHDHNHNHDRDQGFVYFAIQRHSPGNSHLLTFLQKLRDEFRRTGAEQLPPAVRRLVASLEEGRATRAWPAMNGDAEAGTSTKAPLLARPSKQDKRKKKTKKDDNDAGGARDIETPEHRRSDAQGDFKPSSQNHREKWCRQVKIVLAIDAAVCILLLVIWLVICRGINCIR